jgi:DNA-binding HxlR family transcriptional regulator
MLEYGQFCTVARGAEIFGERWTPLVIRELMCGSTRFNDLRRGLPRISATLLAQRLRSLEKLGVVKRVQSGHGPEYHLTPAGEELKPIVRALGNWGARWVGSRLKNHELDAGLLMWDIRRFAHRELFPRQHRTVIQFQFSDARVGERRWWLVVKDGDLDLCRDDPGYEVTLIVDATVRGLTEIWSGDRTPEEVMRAREVRVLGNSRDARSLWRWIGASPFAPTRREALQGKPVTGAASRRESSSPAAHRGSGADRHH